MARDAQKELQGVSVLVRGLSDEVVERVSKPGLSEHLQRSAAVPAVHVEDLCGAVFRQSAPQSDFELLEM